ncbi:MAG: hypothetical protein AB1489_31125, partial [Acidobacteriota bacterium]
PVIPDVLGTYQLIGDNLDILTNSQFVLNGAQRAQLDTLNRSLFPIGIQNYFTRPVSLSMPASS